MDRIDLTQSQGRKSLPEQQANIGALSAASDGGVLASGQSRVMRDMQRRYDAVRNGLAQDPVSTTVRNFSQIFQQPAPLTFEDTAALNAGIQQRSRIVQFAAQNWQVPNLPAFDQADVDSIKAELSRGIPGTANAIVSALQTLPESVYRATMMTGSMKDALNGMVRTYDPVKLEASMKIMDQLWRTDKIGFANVYGSETLDRLQTWQARRDSLNPQQMAEHFRRADDPAQSAAREALLAHADEKLKKVSPGDVAASLGGSWGITPAFISQGVTGSDPLPPADPMQAETLAAEWKSLVRERYVDTGSIDTAKQQAGERIKMTWGPSALTGNALMRYPPERYYPQIDGSHGWLEKDLQKSIETQYGARTTLAPDAEITGQIIPRVNWSYKLMSDTQTEADVKGGRAPSYVVMVTGADGRMNVPLGTDGRPMRYRFDPAEAQAAARDEFAGDRARLLGQRDRMRERSLAAARAATSLQVP